MKKIILILLVISLISCASTPVTGGENGRKTESEWLTLVETEQHKVSQRTVEYWAPHSTESSKYIQYCYKGTLDFRYLVNLILMDMPFDYKTITRDNVVYGDGGTFETNNRTLISAYYSMWNDKISPNLHPQGFYGLMDTTVLNTLISVYENFIVIYQPCKSDFSKSFIDYMFHQRGYLYPQGYIIDLDLIESKLMNIPHEKLEQQKEPEEFKPYSNQYPQIKF